MLYYTEYNIAKKADICMFFPELFLFFLFFIMFHLTTLSAAQTIFTSN